MELIELTEADADAYWALRLRALREEPEAFGSSYDESKDRPLSAVSERLREMTAQGDFTLGVIEDGQLVGIAAFVREPGHKNRHIANIYQMYVAPEVRGKGYGRALLESLIARARAMDGLEQLLLAVVEGNTSARTLYDRLGFEVYGVQRKALKLADGDYRDEALMVSWL